MTDLSGVSAFPITPSAPDGTVDLGALRAVLARLTQAGVDSIGLLGSTGSYPYFTRAERLRTIEAAVAVAGATPLLVGVGALRTDDAVKLAQDAKAAGATAGLLAPVSYTPLMDDEVFAHFATVAGEGGLPLCIYDNPSTTHFAFTPALVARVSRIPGVIAFKGGAPDAAVVAAHLAALREAAPDGFAIGMAVDWNATEALLAGCDAWFSVVAGLFPQPCVAIIRAIRAGDAAEARRLNAMLAPLWALFREFTSLRVMYAAANLLDICHAAPPLPILPLGAAARAKIAAVIAELGLA